MVLMRVPQSSGTGCPDLPVAAAASAAAASTFVPMMTCGMTAAGFEERMLTTHLAALQLPQHKSHCMGTIDASSGVLSVSATGLGGLRTTATSFVGLTGHDQPTTSDVPSQSSMQYPPPGPHSMAVSASGHWLRCCCFLDSLEAHIKSFQDTQTAAKKAQDVRALLLLLLKPTAAQPSWDRLTLRPCCSLSSLLSSSLMRSPGACETPRHTCKHAHASNDTPPSTICGLSKPQLLIDAPASVPLPEVPDCSIEAPDSNVAAGFCWCCRS